MEKTAQFTKGPWIVLPPSQGIDDNWHVTDKGDTFVAHVFGFDHSVDENSRVNAHLIAAAPDLYDALNDIVEHAKNNGKYQITIPMVGKIKAALDKATAKEPTKWHKEIMERRASAAVDTVDEFSAAALKKRLKHIDISKRRMLKHE